MKEFMEALLSFLGNIGITTILVGLIFKYLPERILNNFFAKDLEKYKAELKSTSDKEIAEINAYLRVQAFQHEKSFAILQEKRALVIEEMYKKLVVFINSAESFVNPMQWAGEESKELKAKKTKKAADDFQQFYRTKKVYFDEEFCEKMDDIDKKMIRALNNYITFTYPPNDYDVTTYQKILKASHDTIKNEVNILLKDIESEFRKIIGVN